MKKYILNNIVLVKHFAYIQQYNTFGNQLTQ